MTTYEINRDNLMMYYPKREEILEKLDEIECDGVSYKGNLLTVLKDGKEFHLTSVYDTKRYAKAFAKKRLADSKREAVIWIFGFGDGEYIRELLDETTDNIILVYEPDPRIFKCVMENKNISDILSNSRLYTAIGEIGDKLVYEFLISFVPYTTLSANKMFDLPNYLNLYFEQMIFLVRKYKERYVELHMTKNTLHYFEGMYVNNMLRSLPDAVNQYSIEQIKKAVNTEEFKDFPAILVSGGPSLDKNVKMLKKAKNKAFILAVDTALKTLVRNDIVPDLSITVDPEKPTVLFQHEKIKDIPLVVSQDSNVEIFDYHKGKRFYFAEERAYIASLYRDYSVGTFYLETGGSVATNAFSLLRYLGFTNIILVGQDLAYPNNQFHSKDAYDGNEEALQDENKYYYVEDIYGGKVLTEGNMDMYRLWFENCIVRNSELNVIDATEGGAKINGTTITTLDNAIDTYCKKEIDIDEVFRKIEPAIKEADREKVIEKIKAWPEKYADIKNSISIGIKNYNRIIELVGRGKAGNSEYNRLVKDNSKLYNDITREPIMEFPKMYTWNDEYDVQAKVFDYDKDASQYTQVKDTCEQGITMLKSYSKGIDEFLKEYPKLLENLKYTED